MNGRSTSISNTARRVTDVAQIVVAARIVAVCKADQLVAMHFATPKGIVVVRMPLADFVEKAQAARDNHGVPFTTPLAPDQAEVDAEQVPITKGNPERAPAYYQPNRYGPRGLTPEVRSALRAAFQARKLGQNSRTQGEIADALGVHPSTVSAYFSRFRDEANTTLYTNHAPITKPNGLLL